jgi:hypothetical protein
MTATDPNTTPKSDFVAAEEIKGILRDRDKPEQERIIRWVSESLDLSIVHSRPTRDHVQAIHHDPHAQSSESQAHAHDDASARPRDIRSFVQGKQPKSDVQFVAVVAYYHRFVAPEPERKDAITSDDIQNAARLAQRPVFKTPSVPLNNCVQQGYMDRAARGEYRLNAVGENLVAMTLPGSGEGKANGGRPSKKQRKAPTISKKPRVKKKTRES